MKRTHGVVLALLCVLQAVLALWVVFVGFAHGFLLSSCASPRSAPCNTDLGTAGQVVMVAGSLLAATLGTVFAIRLNLRGGAAWWIPVLGCVGILLFWWAGSSMVEASLPG
ncbi:hypothetical protein [Lysinibacter cavernae]|uniref:Uncharacterized protein n=1 Tax=Lysinibacter cavernae TaxID=1640652 RepID=A0A7X5TUK0_9MICO|nr:hypothetical protein [Lysinibacter cavernae]NIH53647.1 hypothetical protein [Lysinibacter cavernae]